MCLVNLSTWLGCCGSLLSTDVLASGDRVLGTATNVPRSESAPRIFHTKSGIPLCIGLWVANRSPADQ